MVENQIMILPETKNSCTEELALAELKLQSLLPFSCTSSCRTKKKAVSGRDLQCSSRVYV